MESAKIRELIRIVKEVGPHLNENEVDAIFRIFLIALQRMEKEGEVNASN